MALPAPPRGAARSARLRLALVLFVALVAAVVTGVAATPRADPTEGARAVGALARSMGAQAADLRRQTLPPSTAAPPPAPTTTGLPLPDPIPDDPYAPTPEVVLGTLEIPRLGVSAPLQEGITLTAINRGPGHWPGTPMPGGLGNMVIAGHRTTYSKPFNRIDELVAGDRVVFAMPDGPVTYEVRGVIVVPAENIGIAAQSSAHTATLFACHPKGSATHRIVAKLRLVNPDGTYADPDGALPPLDQGADPVTGTTLLVASGPSSSVEPGHDPFTGNGDE